MSQSRFVDVAALTLVIGLLAPVALPAAGPQGGDPGAASRQEESVEAAANQEESSEGQRLDVPEVLVIGRREVDGVPRVPAAGVGSRDVFGPDRVTETGARDLNDLVQHLPAISTRPYNGGEAAAPSFSMRGLPDDGLTEYVHILIDGIPASPLPYGWTALSFLPLSIERVHSVDLIRGAHTVRYSPNTIGGIVNFVTRPIPEEPEVNLEAKTGSFGFTSHSLSAGGTWEGTGVLLSAVDRRGEGYRAEGDFDQQDLHLKLRGGDSEDDWWALSLGHMQSEHQAPGGLTLEQFAQNRFGNARPRNRFNGWRTAADAVLHRGEEDSWMEGFLYASETGRRLDAQRPHFGEPETLLRWNDESYFAGLGTRLHHEFELLGLDHTLFGGLRYHGEWLPSWKIRSEPLSGGESTRTQDSEFELETFSAHLDDTVEVTEALTVTLGARVEWVPIARGKDEISGFRHRDRYFKVLPGVGAS